MQRPPINAHPAVVDTAAYSLLFHTLDIENIITVSGHAPVVWHAAVQTSPHLLVRTVLPSQVFRLMIVEERIVFHSSNVAALTPVIEALLSLLFPLKWVGTYVPYLPTDFPLSHILDAPGSYILGSSTAFYRTLEDTSRVGAVRSGDSRAAATHAVAWCSRCRRWK